MRRLLVVGMGMALAVPVAALADEDESGEFITPLIADSPTPDTELIFSHQYTDEETRSRQTAEVEGEVKIVEGLSVSVQVPYTFIDPDNGPQSSAFDNVEIAVKFAHTPTRDLLIGGGLEVELPTGDEEEDVGDVRAVGIAPYLDAGIRFGRAELVGFLFFEVPMNESDAEADEVDLEIGYNLSFSYAVTDRLWGFVEFDGSHVAIGEEEKTVVNLSPGVRFAPFGTPDVQLAASVGFPLTEDREFDMRTLGQVLIQF
ncbi:MAG: hypothetical protein CMM50_15415 [Rhodospirillaceae bacterium]|nr:hypothetical protein [Rhodospirillaceae bacterium]|tara:strand:- start:7 stop:780 length:774 start_codon:yes stop_codon:yes gene_type:complete